MPPPIAGSGCYRNYFFRFFAQISKPATAPMPSKASAFGSGMGLGTVVIAKTGKASEARTTPIILCMSDSLDFIEQRVASLVVKHDPFLRA